MEEFEREIKKILDEKFLERVKNLKKERHIFNPLFYLFFTRLVEVSGIFRNVVLPNKYELQEFFETRKDFLQIDYETIEEFLRHVWIYERSKGIEFSFERSSDDMLFVIYRMGKIQREIDEAIMRHAEWTKEKLIELYFTLLRIFVEIDDEINRRIHLET
ncbi:MAG: hypothetical protein N3D09_01195 [Archaeoglobaceae archaeon]|nr:hypothetical protein [Archaeoglobaceae archaeon]